MTLNRTMSLSDLAAGLDERLALVDEVERGVMSRDDAVAKMVALGDPERAVRRFLLHTLDQASLNAARAATGVIVD